MTSIRARAGARAGASPETNRGDIAMRGLCAGAGLLVLVTLVAVLYEIVRNAEPAITKFGLGFLGHTTWAPNTGHFGAATMLFGTGVTSVLALIITTPLSIGIGLYLAIFTPPPPPRRAQELPFWRRLPQGLEAGSSILSLNPLSMLRALTAVLSGEVRQRGGWKALPRLIPAVVGPLVEMLAAIPSVVLGFFGIIVFAPFIANHVEGPLHTVFGWTGLFGPAQPTGISMFTASLILTVMIIPIVASLSRDLFRSVPADLIDGAEALGATRWEVIRGIVIPTTRSGLVSAVMLGLGRALGEALAVALTIGGGSAIHADLLQTGNTMAARIAQEIEFPVSELHVHSLYYLALVLLVIGILTNLIARMITRRYSAPRI